MTAPSRWWDRALADWFIDQTLVRWRRRYDPTDHRKSRDGDISAMGGIRIFLSVLVAAAVTFLCFGIPVGNGTRWHYVSLGASATITRLTGVVDDLVNLRAIRKLPLQLLAASVAVAGGWVIPGVICPVTGAALECGSFAVPVTLFWIVGISNAMNLIDGIDGSAAVVTLFASLSFAALALYGGIVSAAVVAFAVAGAVGAFLVFNAPPARIFMGGGSGESPRSVPPTASTFTTSCSSRLGAVVVPCSH